MAWYLIVGLSVVYVIIARLMGGHMAYAIARDTGRLEPDDGDQAVGGVLGFLWPLVVVIWLGWKWILLMRPLAVGAERRGRSEHEEREKERRIARLEKSTFADRPGDHI